MISEWISRVGSVIPRGFSRQYILNLLKQQPMTGKEIIDKATEQSDGKWKPSPGLIYPLLRRLEDDGLVRADAEGKYSITKKGLDITDDLESFSNIVQRQVDVMLRVGNVGRFVAMDLLDRVATIGSSLSSNLDALSEQERQKYREFLESELKKLDQASARKSGNEKVRVD
jgi:DNA-binding PadR family transcriptional regulator